MLIYQHYLKVALRGGFFQSLGIATESPRERLGQRIWLGQPAEGGGKRKSLQTEDTSGTFDRTPRSNPTRSATMTQAPYSPREFCGH